MAYEGRLAVVGAGGWGQNLLRDFVTLLGADRVVCCDLRAEVREAAAARYPGLRLAANLDELWGDPSIRAVVVATDAATHAEVGHAALEHGCHLFVEKPLALRVEDAEALRVHAEAAGRVLQVDHLLLFDPAFAGMLRLARDGALGNLRFAYARRTNLGVVRTNENALWSLGPHDVAVMLRLFGAAPDRITARGGAFVQPGIEDLVYATLEFPAGQVGHLHLSWLDPHKVRSFTLGGSEAMVDVDDARADRLMLHRRSVSIRDGRPQPVDAGSEAVAIAPDQPLLRACRHFLALAAGETQTQISDGRLGVEVVRVLQQATTALHTGATA